MEVSVAVFDSHQTVLLHKWSLVRTEMSHNQRRGLHAAGSKCCLHHRRIGPTVSQFMDIRYLPWVRFTGLELGLGSLVARGGVGV